MEPSQGALTRETLHPRGGLLVLGLALAQLGVDELLRPLAACFAFGLFGRLGLGPLAVLLLLLGLSFGLRLGVGQLGALPLFVALMPSAFPFPR